MIQTSRSLDLSTLTLQERIDRAVGMGYRVVSQTPTSVQLVRPKRFSAGWMLAWTIFSLGALFWVYPLHYLAKREEQAYIRVPDVVSPAAAPPAAR